MKRILLACTLLSATLLVKAQDTPVKEVINTLKERISLTGYVQTGYTYDDTGNGSNTFDIKRAILTAKGKITDKWSFCFMYNFANTGKITELYTEYKFRPEFSVRFGQFKTMFSLENPMSPSTLELISVCSQVVNYLAGYNGSDPLYGSTSGRDLGLLIYGDLFNKFVSYNLAVMNGQGINTKDKNHQKDIVGGLMFHPTKWLSAGGSFIKGKGCAINTSNYVPGIHVGDSYTRNRWAASALLTTKPLDLRTEYLAGKDGHVKSNGYYATASVHVLPKFDVIASYDYFNRNKEVSDKQTNYVAGVQYWFYPKCRLQAQYVRCNPHHGESSNMLQTQLQVRF